MSKIIKKIFDGGAINRVIVYLTLSDMIILSGWGLVSPILAIFWSKQIIGGSIELAGFAATTFLLIKSLGQIPIARFIDKTDGEKDDFWIMISGSLIISLAAFLYAFARFPWHVIGLQVLYGAGAALAFPSWIAIFTRHIDKKQEGFQWSLYSTSTGLGAAAAASVGGILASTIGYRPLFLIVGTFSLVGTLFLAGIENKLICKKS